MTPPYVRFLWFPAPPGTVTSLTWPKIMGRAAGSSPWELGRLLSPRLSREPGEYQSPKSVSPAFHSWHWSFVMTKYPKSSFCDNHWLFTSVLGFFGEATNGFILPRHSHNGWLEFWDFSPISRWKHHTYIHSFWVFHVW